MNKWIRHECASFLTESDVIECVWQAGFLSFERAAR